ncbi:MAG TPA: ABC transporter permease [Vicinamibacterales bacterium]|nr:ABC transporter permease [Vicinamibacterales bacterium]
MTAGLAAFLVRRLVTGFLFVLVVSSSALVLTRLAPGDAAVELLPGGLTTMKANRERLHLDRPIVWQLGEWLQGLAHFDLGRSLLFERPVGELVRGRAGRTATLASVALALATIVAIPLGLATGAYPRSMLARFLAPISLAMVACPPLIAALVLLWLALSTRWFSVAPGSLAVPALALSLPLAAMMERLQSRATADMMSAPDLVAAAARGVPPGRLLWVHAARQSLRPVLGIFGIVIGTVFSGSLAVEWATSWPGLGRLMYEAVATRDVFLVTGCAFAGATMIALGNIVADLTRALIDPRVRGQA